MGTFTDGNVYPVAILGESEDSKTVWIACIQDAPQTALDKHPKLLRDFANPKAPGPAFWFG